MMWIDCETTGLDKDLNGIIEIAFIAPNGDTFKATMKPFKGCIINDEALEVNGYTRDQIKVMPMEKRVVKEIVTFLEKHVAEKGARFHLAGYNCDFDMGFVSQLFKRNDINWWNYFDYYNVDVYSLVKILNAEGKLKPTLEGKLKLGHVCDAYNVKIKKAHSAIDDIKATQKLYKRLSKCLRK